MNPPAKSNGDKTLNFVFRARFHPLLRYYVAPSINVPKYE